MKKLRLLLFWSPILLLGSDSFGQVRTFVSPEGSDTNPCTLQQPCRNFAAAMTAVAAGGEVVALATAGYGSVLISKSVTLVAPQGVHAAIAPTSGTAITISAASTDKVVLRNLYLNSQGASVGIDADGVEALHVESCVANGFSSLGIRFHPITGRLHLSDTMIRHSEGYAIQLAGGSGLQASVESVQMRHNAGGIRVVNDVRVVIRNSVSSGSAFNLAGFEASSPSARVSIEDSVAMGHGYGFNAVFGGKITVTRSVASANSIGIRAEGTGSIIYVSDSTIAGNDTGAGTASSGEIQSRNNNTLQANGSNGAFTNTFSPN